MWILQGEVKSDISGGHTCGGPSRAKKRTATVDALTSLTPHHLRGTLITMTRLPAQQRETEARMRVLRDTFIDGQPVEGAPAWVRTWPDLHLLARRHDLPWRMVRSRAASQDWEAARARSKVRAEAFGEQQRAEQRMRTSVLAEVDALVSVEKGLHLVRDRLESMESATAEWRQLRQAYHAALAVGDTQAAEEMDYDTWTPHPVDVRDLKGLADAGRGYVEMLQATLGTTTMNVVVSGPGGGPVQVDHIHRVLSQDDPDRLYALIEAINRAQIASVVEGEVVEIDDDDEVEEIE